MGGFQLSVPCTQLSVPWWCDTVIGKLLWVMEMLIASWPVWHGDQFHGWRQMKYYGANSFMEKAEWVRLCSWFNANHAMVHKTNESTHDRSWANTLKKIKKPYYMHTVLKDRKLEDEHSNSALELKTSWSRHGYALRFHINYTVY